MKTLRWVTALTVGILAVLAACSIAERSKYRNITSEILRTGSFDLGTGATSTVACAVPFQVSLSALVADELQGYSTSRPPTAINPDIDIYWTILLIDRTLMTYEIFVVEQARIESLNRRVCARKLTLSLSATTAGTQIVILTQ